MTSLLKQGSRCWFKRENFQTTVLKGLPVFSDINEKFTQRFKATVLQADFRTPKLSNSTSRFQVQHLLPNQQGLLSGAGSLFPSHQRMGLWKDSDLWVRDSYKRSVQAQWQAAHLVTDELVSWRAEPMYLANDRAAMLIKSMWIVKKSKYWLYTKCPWWIDSSCCVLLPFQHIHSNYMCNSEFALNLFVFTGILCFQGFANDKVLHSAPGKDLSPYPELSLQHTLASCNK